jgi:hypothetical protein
MPSGHTDKATINQRRPLTDRMRSALASIARGERRADMHGIASLLHWYELSQPEKNSVGALRDRGLVSQDEGGALRLTNQGREALQ